MIDKKAEQEIPNFHISSFKTYDKKEMKYNVWSISKDKPKEVIVYLNGLESHCGWFSESAHQLVEQGIPVYGLDKRSGGLNSNLRGDYNSWFKDTETLINIVRRENPEADINLVALCFGTKIAAGTAAKNPKSVDSLAYISPGFYMTVDLNCIEKTMTALSLSGMSIPLHSPIKDYKMFTTDPKNLDYINKDLMKVVSPTSRDFLQAALLNSVNEENLNDLDKSGKPSIAFIAGKDQVIDVTKTLLRFSNLENIKTLYYPESEHIIFFGKDKERFIEDLVDFIKTH
jgi:alpha-beta hydrolase superfamily lysophospholipase